MDYAALARDAIEIVKPVVVAGGAAAVAAGGVALVGGLEKIGADCWDWIKRRFTAPAQAQAVTDAAQRPGEAAAWDALRGEIEQALAQDESFRRELLERLPVEIRVRYTHVQYAPQTIIGSETESGGGQVKVQSQGNNVSIRIDGRS